MELTKQEKEAKCQIQLRGLVGEFVAHCRQTRPTFSYDTWRRAFRDTENDSVLLEWTRQQAIEFLKTQTHHLTHSTTPPQPMAATVAA